MCGISGIWHSYKESDSDLIIKAKSMADGLTHRGPDASGVWIREENGICFSHRRLSIIDLSNAGKQPMNSKNERFTITFNGEIYNHLELRKNIENKFGYKFPWKGYSDTETFLEHIQAFGIEETLKKSYGMFACALWDNFRKELILIRDRFGEKPLYWGYTNLNNQINKKVLVFSSELSGIFNLKGFVKSINHNSLNEYFKYGYISGCNSIQDGIQQLEPGTILKIKANNDGLLDYGNEILLKWWDSKKVYLDSLHIFEQNKFQLDEDYFLNLLEDQLFSVINQQSVSSDVPIGCLLSGGIDSSLVTSILQKNSNRPINSFTAKFEGFKEIKSEFDESLFAKNISDYLGTDHNEITISPQDVLKIIPNIGKHFSEPFSDSSQVPTFLICKYIKSSGISVALSGDGADELFGGYNRHLYIPFINKYIGNLPRNIKFLLHNSLKLIPISNKGLLMDKFQKLNSSIINSDNIHQIYDNLKSIQNYYLKDLSLNYQAKNQNYKSLDFFQTIEETIMMEDTTTYLPSDILVKVDRSAMASSLETRIPFLDKRIAEVAWMMPLRMKIRNKNGKKISKWALKKILNKYIPEKLTARPKQGFSMPIGNWINGPLNSWVKDMLSYETINSQGFINPKTVENILKKHSDGTEDNSARLWNILMWQSWLSEWY